MNGAPALVKRDNNNGSVNGEAAVEWHALPNAAEACRVLLVDSKVGLTDAEAAQRLQVHGKNALTPPEKPTLLKRIWQQVNNILVLILIAAAVVSGVLKEWPEVGLILGVIAINITIGIVQEGNAEKAAEALKAMLSPLATVVRGGERKSVDAVDLVPGDIVFVQSGDRIPADVRWLSVTNLQVQEAMLTGESLPVAKGTAPAASKAALGDRRCMGFSATLVMSGQALGVVVETGDWAEIGKINALVAGVDADAMKTNLLVQLEIFGRFISIVVLIIGVTALLVAHLARDVPIGIAFQAAVAIAVAIIPEGLPAVVTITLAVGVQSMASKHAIIRQLPAVEALGSVNVICSDKTGTLTKNEMTAVGVVAADAQYRVTGAGYAPTGDLYRDQPGAAADASAPPIPAEEAAAVRALLVGGVHCNDSALTRDAAPADCKASATQSGGSVDGWRSTGDPTELALLTVALKAGFTSIADAQQAAPRLGAVPFESEHKFMATVHAATGGYVMHVKGAPDRLLPRCALQVKGVQAALHPVHENSSAAVTEPVDREFWSNSAAELSARGLRVLALCRAVLPQECDPASVTTSTILEGEPLLTMVCLVAILDPPRDEAVTAIAEAHSAGIVVKMITGDHPKTALAIAGMLGIVSNGAKSDAAAPPAGSTIAGGREEVTVTFHAKPLVFTGPQLDAMTDDELAVVVMHCNVFARASPENKIRIVRALQKNGQICSMTGDGVNDAPALKAANIGVAMGITGTEVSKEAAKMVLADDNFASIIAAVKEGRRVWDNLRKILLFTLPTNFAQGFATFFAYIVGMENVPLTPVQILYVNMVSSVTMGIAFAFEPAEADVMQRPPRHPRKRLFGKQTLWRCFFVSGLVTAGILGQFAWNLTALQTSLPAARTEAFTTLLMCEATYALNTRFLHATSLSPAVFHGNKWFWLSMVIMLGLQVVLVHVPGINEFFSNEPLDGAGWGRSFGLAVLLYLIVELEKAAAPRFIMPVLGPCMRAVRRAFTAPLHPGAAGVADAPSQVRFIATSASSFGLPMGASTRRLVPPRSSRPPLPQAPPTPAANDRDTASAADVTVIAA